MIIRNTGYGWAGLLFIGALLWLAPRPVPAQEQCERYPERDVRPQALTERTYQELSDIYEDIGEEKYNEAASALQKLLEDAKEGTYERAIILQALGHVETSRENYDLGLKYFKESVEIDALPNTQHFQMIYAIAQIEIMDERYRDGLQTLNHWLCVVPPDQITANAYVLKANAHIELKEFRPALAAIEKAIDMSDEPKKSYYQLKLAAHYELEELGNAATTLKTMIGYWPEDQSLWKQLSSVYLNLERNKEALSVLELAYKKGHLDKKSEYEQLSSLYQLQDIPYQAAQVLEDGLGKGILENGKKYWERAGNAWYQARELEKALAAYEKAGRFADDGKIDMRRGYILVDRQNWEAAKAAFTRAIEKGGISEREIGNAWLLTGMSEMELENYSAALEAFQRAQRYPDSRQAARQWIVQVRERQAVS